MPFHAMRQEGGCTPMALVYHVASTYDNPAGGAIDNKILFAFSSIESLK